jgi:hypothetical protein
MYKILPIIISLIIYTNSYAQIDNSKIKNIPEILTPWISWVLNDEKKSACPFLYNQQQQQCEWQNHLDLKVQQQYGEFTQKITRYNDGWSALIGNEKIWIQNVYLNGKKAIVTNKNGIPSIFLTVGEHKLQGNFNWQSTPKFLQLPLNIALINLTINDKKVDIPKIDKQWRLWLNNINKNIVNKKNRVDMRIYRQVIDSMPLILNIHLELEISGKHREIIFERIMDTEFYIPM